MNFVDLSIEFHREWEKYKGHTKRLTIPDIQADDLEAMGILVGKVYDEKFSEESWHMGKVSFNELLETSKQLWKKG